MNIKEKIIKHCKEGKLVPIVYTDGLGDIFVSTNNFRWGAGVETSNTWVDIDRYDNSLKLEIDDESNLNIAKVYEPIDLDKLNVMWEENNNDQQ